MESFFSINVATLAGKNYDKTDRYEHYFKVDIKGHHKNYCNVEEVHADLVAKFPAPEYKIDVTFWDAKGKTVTL